MAGYRAVVREVRATEGGFFPEGTRTYTYLIDRDGLLFDVRTTALPELEANRYRANREVVDRAVETLRFTD